MYLVDGLLSGALSPILGGGSSGKSRVCIRGIWFDLISFELELAVFLLCTGGRDEKDVGGIVMPNIDDWEPFRELPATEDWLVASDAVEALKEDAEPVRKVPNENDEDVEDCFRRMTFRGRFSGDSDPPNTECDFVGGLVRGFNVVTGVIVGEFITVIGFGRLLFLGWSNVESFLEVEDIGRRGGDEVDCSFGRSLVEEGLRRSLGTDN